MMGGIKEIPMDNVKVICALESSLWALKYSGEKNPVCWKQRW